MNLKLKSSAHGKWLYFGGGLLVVAVILTICLTVLHFAWQGKIIPGENLAGVELSGLTTEEAELRAQAIINDLPKRKLSLDVLNENKELSLQDLQIEVGNVTQITPRSYPQTANLAQVIRGYVIDTEIPLEIDFDQNLVNSAIYDTFPDLKTAKDARFVKNDLGEFVVSEGSEGYKIAWPDMEKDLLKAINSPSIISVEVPMQLAQPEITAEMLTAEKDRLLALLASNIVLTSNNNRFELNLLGEELELIGFKKQSKTSAGLSIRLENLAWAKYIDEKLKPAIEVEPQAVTIDYDKTSNKAVFSSNGELGVAIEVEKLTTEIEEKLNDGSGDKTIKIPTKFVEGDVTIAPELQEMGIRELITVGDTAYYGSAANRLTNIGVGADKFNGFIIEKDAVFSFNDNLGPVDASTGYVPGLVIKADGTYPEYGGGLCQVSTTLYRAVLNADFEILERRPHSYAVSYYAQRLGHGLDATIYPGSVDFKFKNDTGGAIAIQTYTKGPELYFKLYGLKTDVASVEYDGPYISNNRSPGAAIEILDPSMAPGSRVQVESPHAGFDVLWYKIVSYKDGSTAKKEIFSKYRAVPAKFKIGPPAQTENTTDSQTTMSTEVISSP